MTDSVIQAFSIPAILNLNVISDDSNNVYVDLLVVVKTVKPAKTIKTRAGKYSTFNHSKLKYPLNIANLKTSFRFHFLGVDMSVRGVEIMDNTTPAAINLDIFDVDTIQRFHIILNRLSHAVIIGSNHYPKALENIFQMIIRFYSILSKIHYIVTKVP